MFARIFRSGVRRCSNEAALAPKWVGNIESTVLLFPGQGSQFIGMANKLSQFPKTELLFNTASDILGYDLLKTCLNGPFEYLTRTEVSQPAILVTSLAALEKLNLENPQALDSCKATAGLSLGEYSSLVFSGCLSFEDAVRIVMVRGKAMQDASDQSNGGMVSIMTSKETNIDDLCNAAIDHCISKNVVRPVCQASNFLSSSIQVVGGSIEAIDYIIANSTKYAIRKCKKLAVSGAFHTQMMSCACERLSEALESVKIHPPNVPVISNVTAKPYKDAQEIKDLLIKQVVSPVRWQQSMDYIFDLHLTSPQTIYEMGPGRNLKSLVKSSKNSNEQHIYNFVDV